MNPARYAILPETVGTDLLTTAAGLFTSADHVAYLIASALVGIVLLVLGTRGAVWADALSFVVVALCIAIAHLPRRTRTVAPTSSDTQPVQRSSVLREMVVGWQIIQKQPVIRAIAWLSLLINVASFIGPLYPALISQRLHGSAISYSLITTAGVIGGILGGILAGSLERRLGAGRLMVVGWSLAGLTFIGMAISTSLPLTAALEAAGTFGLIVGSVPISSLMLVLVPEEYRGRVQGMVSSLVILAIPFSAALGGWLTDLFGAAPLFAAGGLWVIGVAALAWGNRHIRTARVER
jgi:predicted MFS family arabinose efflux permease